MKIVLSLITLIVLGCGSTKKPTPSLVVLSLQEEEVVNALEEWRTERKW